MRHILHLFFGGSILLNIASLSRVNKRKKPENLVVCMLRGNAVVPQSGPCIEAFNCWTVQFSPWQVLLGGCSLPGPITSQLTACRLRLAASVANCVSGTTFSVQMEEFRMWLIASKVEYS
jgi:hypothetical protein